jgi:hypothetical protein
MVRWLRPFGLKASSAVDVFRWSGVCVFVEVFDWLAIGEEEWG